MGKDARIKAVTRYLRSGLAGERPRYWFRELDRNERRVFARCGIVPLDKPRGEYRVAAGQTMREFMPIRCRRWRRAPPEYLTKMFDRWHRGRPARRVVEIARSEGVE